MIDTGFGRQDSVPRFNIHMSGHFGGFGKLVFRLATD